MTYQRPTAQQRRLLEELLETGTLTAAAGRLGISAGAASSRMRQARRRTGTRSTEQMIAFGVRDGWISVHESCKETL